MSNKLDIILFGATGFTGKRTIPKLHQIITSERLSLTWGIAGRSEQKLKHTLKEIEENNGSICFINIFYGEPIVKACLVTSTHYLDVTGEPEFMEKIQLYYHEEAFKKQIYLISSCGMDSIPCDMGAIFMMKNFKGTLNSIEAFIHITEEGGSHPGPTLNYATWASAVHGLANYEKLTEIRSKLFLNRLPRYKPNLKLKLFSLGSFTLGGPSEEKQKTSLYNLYLEGEGWSEKLSEPTDQFKSPPNKTISVKVTTRNPAYGATCTAAVLSAIMILTESDKMPNGGGCYTPGVAFANTSLIQKLDKYGMKFEIRSKL
ncbi:hypothetical protein MML48_3g00005033 [Holotrichia oblita]|uniref:Uncharacterized protein n=1 Tax=Holotrichia oblita TaxID=644536 RepID=A0ACB9TGL6_HOLOL|nr:hypothetical protein MML48_3g00005033 [Holotrichia oblita]